MILVSYDIKNDRLRSSFSKYLKKFGYRLQYSVFEITHSKSMLSNIKFQIENNFKNRFTDEDSILVIETSENCKITRMGYIKHDEADGVIIV
jgi:CRISPR-associated protein Cas2